MAEPEKIGKYEIRSVLGKGAMGVVYKGFDPQVERTVAIKTVRKDLVDPDLAVQILGRFRNEARAAGRLLHPNIVTIYEFGEDGNTAFIAMEFVEGMGLSEYLSRKAGLGLVQIVSIMSQLLQALNFAHERGVVHRDIKPANLILTADGALKVADFGIARIDTSNLTSVGTIIGTPSYMSPEQCQGLAVDHRSDLFSAGVVLYELLAGDKPFSGALETIVYKICHELPAPPSTRSPLTLPPAVDALLARALAKKQDARFASARQFQLALREAFAAETSPGGDAADDRTMLDLTGVALQAAPLPAWEDALLNTVERQLANFVGPMAKVMVRKAAANSHNLAGLYSLLSEHIGNPGERRRFVDGLRDAQASTSSIRAHSSTSGTGTGGTATRAAASARPPAPSAGDPAPADGEPLDAAFVEQVTGKLAVHLGPIAKVVARKAAQKTTSRQEFVRIVAGHLGVQERGAFLREIGFSVR